MKYDTTFYHLAFEGNKSNNFTKAPERTAAASSFHCELFSRHGYGCCFRLSFRHLSEPHLFVHSLCILQKLSVGPSISLMSCNVMLVCNSHNLERNSLTPSLPLSLSYSRSNRLLTRRTLTHSHLSIMPCGPNTIISSASTMVDSRCAM